MHVFRKNLLLHLRPMKKLCYSRGLNGSVAQLVEQRIENPRVGSSILPQATRYTKKACYLNNSGLFSFWPFTDCLQTGEMNKPQYGQVRAHKKAPLLAVLYRGI